MTNDVYRNLELNVDEVVTRTFLFEQGIHETPHSHSSVWSDDFYKVRGACCLSCGRAVYSHLVRNRDYNDFPKPNPNKLGHIAHCSNVKCENNEGDWCEPFGIDNSYFYTKITDNEFWPEWVVNANIENKQFPITIHDDFYNIIEESHGNLVLSGTHVYRLIGASSDNMDYYYMFHNGRKVIHGSCVGGFVDLKKHLPIEEYDRMDKFERMNADYVVPDKPIIKWIG